MEPKNKFPNINIGLPKQISESQYVHNTIMVISSVLLIGMILICANWLFFSSKTKLSAYNDSFLQGVERKR